MKSSKQKQGPKFWTPFIENQFGSGKNQRISARGVQTNGTDKNYRKKEIAPLEFKHKTKPGKVTVIHPVKDIPIDVLKSIFDQAGRDWRQR